MSENEIAAKVYTACKKIFERLGPGLLEKTYQTLLVYELRNEELDVKTEVEVPIVYESLVVANAFRIDVLVENKVVIELKAVEEIISLHKAQLLTYLKLTDKKLGLLINFNVRYIGEGITRVVNGLEE